MIKMGIVLFTFFMTIGLYYSNPDQFVSDDSLFYVVIAQYFLDTGLSTFNGYIETNGYHPLWQFLTIIGVYVGRLFSLDTLIVVGFIYHLFIAGSIYLVYKINKIIHFFSVSVIAMIFIFLFIANGTLQNMESAVALFFVLYTLYVVMTIENPKGKRFLLIGMVLGLTFLARLDLVFFGIIVAFYIIFKFQKIFISKPRYLLYFILAGLSMVLPYFTYNILTFGSIAPVSGALKSSFPHIVWSWGNIFPYGIMVFGFSLIALIVAMYHSSRNIKFIFTSLAIATMIHVIYLGMFQFPMSWYYITGYVIMALVIGAAVKKIDIPILTYGFLIVMMVATLWTAYMKTVSNYTLSSSLLGHGKLIYSKESRKKIFGEAYLSELPSKATVFTFDLPGALAYYGKLRVFSADGLITNKVYQQELVELGAKNIFKKYDIKYIIVALTGGKWLWYDGMFVEPFGDGQYKFTFYSRLFHKKSGSLILKKKDIISELPATDNLSSSIVTFKIPDDIVWK